MKQAACSRSMSALTKTIHAEIESAGGSISFARYMELALYAPGLGYYGGGLEKFGAGGDFVTAPEISPLFGRCIARLARQVFAALGGSILEFGAGSGRLAADILLELERLGCLPERYLILEISADLRRRQLEYLERQAPHLLTRVVWLSRLPPPGFAGLIIANEVVDAMPVHRFRIGEDGLHELRVALADERFAWTACPIQDQALADAVDHLRSSLPHSLRAPYTSEVNLLSPAWITSVADVLGRGVILCIDYGYPRHEYYHPERNEGTLMCHYRQHAHSDPLILVGQQDITAFVDFTTLAEAAHANGLDVAGYTTQAHFLFSCGLDQLLIALQDSEPAEYFGYAQQAKTLTLPGQMGERFKAIALAKKWEESPLGFGLLDQRHKL
jgi:SAM-dependent MidA family methyltransferase